MVYDRAEMARRGRITAASGKLDLAREKSILATKGNKDRAARISASLKVALSTPEARADRSQRAKKQWAIPGMKERIAAGVLAAMDGKVADKRYANTGPEVKVKEWLEERGIAFRQQARMFGASWDFAIVGRNVVVEVDGCYWHGCIECGHGDQHPENVQRDRAKDKIAASAGWKVVRLWEHDIKTGAYKTALTGATS